MDASAFALFASEVAAQRVAIVLDDVRRLRPFLDCDLDGFLASIYIEPSES